MTENKKMPAQGSDYKSKMPNAMAMTEIQLSANLLSEYSALEDIWRLAEKNIPGFTQAIIDDLEQITITLKNYA